MDSTLKLCSMTGDPAIDNVVIDTEKKWGIVVLEMPSLFGASVKDVPTREWPDEDGVDAYNAGIAYLGAFDVDIKLGVYTEFEGGVMKRDINESIYEFIRWFTTNGVMKKLYCPHVHQGRQNVRFKSLVPENTVNSNGQFVIEMKLTVEIGDPTTKVTL